MAAPASERIIAHRRSHRSMKVPAMGDKMMRGNWLTRRMIASWVTDPDSRKTQMLIPNQVRPLPVSETTWPNQTIRNARCPSRSDD